MNRDSFTALLLFAVGVASVAAAPADNQPARFCTHSEKEQAKCEAMKKNFADRNLSPGLECVQGIDSYDCMQIIERGEADLHSFWVMDAYIAGRFHHLVPFLRENTETDPEWTLAHYSLAVVRKNDTTISSLEDLRGKRSCHAGVYSLMGWDFGMAQLVSRGLISSGDCDNGVANMASFFSQGCAPVSKDPVWNVTSMCDRCVGQGEDFCSYKDPYGGYEGAIRCLLQGGGDVAFIRHKTFDVMIEKDPTFETRLAEMELLCLDGSRKPVDKFKECTWGAIPDSVVMTSENLSPNRKEVIRDMFVEAQKDQTSFKLFDSSEYGDRDLLFGDDTKSLQDVGERNTYDKYIGDYMMVPTNQYPCTADPVRWCTISEAENRKCLRWRDALASLLVRPELECVQKADTGACMNAIKEGKADLIDLDGGDIYKGGKEFNLQVIMNEVAAHGDAKYYGVAVVKKSNSDISFRNLKGKKSCHTAIGRSAGWNIPSGILLSSGLITNTPDCNTAKAVGEFFNASCAPGALSPQFNPSGQNPESLCAICAGTGDNKCARNENEPFYGYTGAFRCMATGTGDVAFVKHTTAIDNTDGHNQDNWAKDLHLNDFELLCKDNSRKSPNDYKDCNWAKVPTHAVVTGGTRTAEEIHRCIYFLKISQKYLGDKQRDKFRLFVSGPGAKDLLFSDSTTSLSPVSHDKRSFREYLGSIADVYDEINGDKCQH